MASYDPQIRAKKPVEIDLQVDQYTQALYRKTFTSSTGVVEFFTADDPTAPAPSQNGACMIGSSGFLEPPQTPGANPNNEITLFNKGEAWRIYLHGETIPSGWRNEGVLGFGSTSPSTGLVPLRRFQWLGENGSVVDGSFLSTDSDVEIRFIEGSMQTQFAQVAPGPMFVEPTTIELVIVKTSPTDSTPTTDRAKAGLPMIAELTYGASLVVGINSNDYPESQIESVEFSEQDDPNFVPWFTYSPNGSTPNAMSTGPSPNTSVSFAVSALAQGVVRFTDDEQVPTPNANAFYKITFSYLDVTSGKRVTGVLDPELTNKPGNSKTGTKSGGAGWE